MNISRIFEIVKGIRIRIISLIQKRRYSEWGLSSYIRKPIRIIGKKHIFIGEHVFILDGLRMEAIQKWGGENIWDYYNQR